MIPYSMYYIFLTYLGIRVADVNPHTSPFLLETVLRLGTSEARNGSLKGQRGTVYLGVREFIIF